jgi:hypothetical protein
MQEPNEPSPPDELPGQTPSELPVRGPQGPNTPSPATDTGRIELAASKADSVSGVLPIAAGSKLQNADLK